jgi:two-component system, response regulator PdtaR
MNIPALPPVVLVVDDEELIRMAAVDSLEEAGFLTVEAADGDEALRQLVAHPDVVVMFTDINMPGSFDGLMLAQVVHERWPDIRLILTSGRDRPRDCEMPDDGRFIRKPYYPSAIAELVRSVI